MAVTATAATDGTITTRKHAGTTLSGRWVAYVPSASVLKPTPSAVMFSGTGTVVIVDAFGSAQPIINAGTGSMIIPCSPNVIPSAATNDSLGNVLTPTITLVYLQY